MTALRQRILMCPPDFYEVSYVINPWMENNRGRTDKVLAHRQWQGLRDALARHADIALVAPQAGQPDMVFTANAGFVIGNQVVVSQFFSEERQGEAPLFQDWFARQGFEILPWPDAMPFEGAGDALSDREKTRLWVGSGFRSATTTPSLLEALFRRPVAHLHLVDPRFYHLDTCLCPLAGGYLLYYPAAFDEASRTVIAKLVPPEKRIAVDDADALAFACNAVDLENHVFLNAASEALQGKLRAVGFTPVVTPLSEFMKAGGAAKCLTLKLVES